MPREKVIRTSLQNRALLIEVSDMSEACQIANVIAAEHLEICAQEPQQWADKFGMRVLFLWGLIPASLSEIIVRAPITFYQRRAPPVSLPRWVSTTL